MKRNIDLYLFFATILLVLFGLVMIYSASSIWAEYKFDDAFKYVKQQGLFIIIGVFLMHLISKIDYRIYHDKASIIVSVCANDDECEEFGDFDFSESVLESISKNMIKADKKYPNIDKRVFLVTKLEKQNFNLEDDFINSLNPSLGVVMKKGLLTGVMLPIFWEKYATKKDFVNKLKIKSGINPDYWSKDIQIYYFKAVEI